MKKIIFIVLLFLSVPIFSLTKITAAQLKEVYKIGERNGVPLSVVKQLMHEESRGYVDAISHQTAEGFYSRGLYQLYDKPGNIAWLLSMFWDKPLSEFDIYDPIDNATVGLAYISWLHDRYGNWYQSCVYYNHGNIKGYSAETRAYAKRIINAK